jgi:hypothetical protein
MKLKFNFTSIFFLAVTCLSGQVQFPGQGYFPGTLTFTDGHTKNCLVIAPRNPGQSVIYTKSADKAPKEKVKSSLLSSVAIEAKKGNIQVFERLPIARKEGARNQAPRWLYVEIKGYATLYLLPDKFIIDRHGNAYSLNHFTDGDAAIQTYLIRKKNQHVAYYFAKTTNAKNAIGLNAILKKTASWYLKEDKELVKRINEKDLTHYDIEMIITLYNEFMSKK